MILAVHILTGAVVGLILQNYWLVFIVAFLSHFVFDAIPHYEYKIDSIKEGSINKKFFIALIKPFFDLAIGGTIMLCIIWQSNFIGYALVGAFAALLPDGLSLIYWSTKFPLLEKLVSFHRFTIHPPKNKNTPAFWGILTQATVSIIAITLLVFFR